MSRLAATLALVGAFAITSAAHAQQRDTGMRRPPRGAFNRQPNQRPMGPPQGAMMGGSQVDVASMLLAHTGDFKLTDQQVTRLAAITRRTAERRTAMRASADSMRSSRSAPPAGQDAQRRQGPPPAMLAQMQKMRDQSHADLRDAIAVLTVDQQAMGWEMMARRGAPGGPRRSFARGGGGGMSRGMTRGGMGARPVRPPQPRSTPPDQ
jgi:LTXXQ motif family protein